MTLEDGEAEANEQTPLVSVHENELDTHPGLSESTRFRAITLCYVFIVLIEIGLYLQVSPLNAVIEQIICRKYFPDIGVGTGFALIQDTRCKSVEVQGELAMLRGWQSTFEFIPGILTAVPYGIAADKYGRKAVLRLILLGITLQCGFYITVCWLPELFSVQWTWVSSVFLLMGGGPMVLTSVLFVIVADTASESKRASTFFYLGAAVLGGEIIGSPLASILMRYDLWIPIILGFIVIASNNFLLLALPETSNFQQLIRQSPNVATNELIGQETVPNTIPEWVYDNKSRLTNFIDASWLTVGDRNVLLLLTTFVVATLGRYAQEILMQYVTKRYGWTWSQAGFLLSVRAFANLILLLAILPASSYFLTKYMSLSSQQKDLWLARTSAFLLAFGAFSIGVAPTAALMIPGLGFFALGVGLTLLVRSLVASLVHSDQLGTVYSLIAVLESIGGLIAGPMLSLTFREGLKLGDGWIGLPWISAGFLLSLALTALLLVKIEPSSVETDVLPSPALDFAKPEYNISMVQETDIPAIAEISLDMEGPNPTSSSILAPTQLESIKALVATKLLHRLRNDQASQFIKVQNSERYILGYAIWQVSDTSQNEQQSEEQEQSGFKVEADGFDTEAFERIRAAMLNYRKKHVNSKTTYTLSFITVQRLHRREGVARALLHWGLKCADAAGADTWVETPRATIPFYEKFGWVTVDEIKTCSESGRGEEDSVFCMLRKPKLGNQTVGSG